MKIFSLILSAFLLLQTLCGGYTGERVPTKAEIAIFNKVVGVGETRYTPLAVSTQVVAGTNYKFRCSYEDKVHNVSGNCNIVIYNDLQGNCTLTSIDPLEPENVSAEEPCCCTQSCCTPDRR